MSNHENHEKLAKAERNFYDEYSDKYGIWAIGLGGVGLTHIIAYATAANQNIPQEYEGFKVVISVGEPPCVTDQS